MNPFDLSTSDLLVWGIVGHLIADWPLQNDWMANGKGWPWRWSILGLAPAFVHGLIHMVALGVVFGYWPGVILGLVHVAVDTRLPVAWWSRLMRQTQPGGDGYDVGLEVRFWTDQVFHIACIALAALLVA
jgi:hypothetical protein